MANDRTFEDAMHTSLSGSADGSVPDLGRPSTLPSTMEDKINEMAAQLAQIPLFLQSVSRVESCVQTLSQTVAAEVTSMEQIVGRFAARVAALVTGAASASSVSGSARSWPLPG